jgi:hypothetical protein
VPEEIARRLEALRTTTELEQRGADNYYETDKDYDLDSFEQAGYEALIHDAEAEEFKIDLDDDSEEEEES